MSAFGGKKPKHVQAGQPISAKGYNRLIDSVRPVGVGGNAHVLSMHGMTFVTPKKATSGQIIRYEIPSGSTGGIIESSSGNAIEWVWGMVAAVFPDTITKAYGEDQDGLVRIYDPTEHYLHGEDEDTLDGRTGYAILVKVRNPSEADIESRITKRFEFLTMDCQGF